jgi:hypothetical protein
MKETTMTTQNTEKRINIEKKRQKSCVCSRLANDPSQLEDLHRRKQQQRSAKTPESEQTRKKSDRIMMCAAIL